MYLIYPFRNINKIYSRKYIISITAKLSKDINNIIRNIGNNINIEFILHYLAGKVDNC